MAGNEKFYGACAKIRAGNISMAMERVAIQATHVALLDKCGNLDGELSNSWPIGSMDYSDVRRCEADNNDSACKNYQKFKELNVLPKETSDFCTVISVNFNDIVCRSRSK